MCLTLCILMIKKCHSCLLGLCCGGRWTGSSERWPQLAPPYLSLSAKARRELAALSPYAQSPGCSSTTAEMKGTDCIKPEIQTFFHCIHFIKSGQLMLSQKCSSANLSEQEYACLSMCAGKKLLYSGKWQSNK